jgi:APA family basic amino acid/polyamine antiporter
MFKQLFVRKPISQILKEAEGESKPRKVLGPIQLTSLGISMIIGSGIFIGIGKTIHDQTGPVIILSLIVTTIACILAALCYAEFSAMIPVAGSAYTYASASFGRIFAWILGWDLILEYGLGAAAVANGVSNHIAPLLRVFNLELPETLMNSPFDFSQPYFLSGNILNLPALLLTLALTGLLIIGIRENARVNVVIVIIKIAIILFVIVVGAYYFDAANWEPFAPYGYLAETVYNHTSSKWIPVGMLAGAGSMFFSYIGFDSVSNHAEEARSPQRDVPLAIIASLIISTLLYIGISAALTGMVSYNTINIDAPIPEAFNQKGLVWAAVLIAVGVVISVISVIQVTMLSQTRILFAMGRDGLLPENFFTALHKRFGTPWKATILTGIFVSLLSSLFSLAALMEMVCIGTLLAFTIVCAGVLVMRKTNPEAKRPFRTPFVPIVPVLGILTCLLLMFTLSSESWLRLGAWLLIGLVIYFVYGRLHGTPDKEQI